MKKRQCTIMKVFLILFMAVAGLILPSCKNKKDYGKVTDRPCGLYLEFVKVENRTMNDNNVKLYFDYKNKDTYLSDSGNTGYLIEFTSLTHQVTTKDKVTLADGGATIKLQKASGIKEVKFYPIFETSKGSFTISNDCLKVLDVTSSTSFSHLARYTYEKEKYALQISLKIQIA